MFVRARTKEVNEVGRFNTCTMTLKQTVHNGLPLRPQAIHRYRRWGYPDTGGSGARSWRGRPTPCDSIAAMETGQKQRRRKKSQYTTLETGGKNGVNGTTQHYKKELQKEAAVSDLSQQAKFYLGARAEAAKQCSPKSGDRL